MVSKILGETATHCPCDLIWVPSHCGVSRNEHVDKLAFTISLDAQVRVPIDYADAKQRVKTSPVADKLVERMPENLQVSTRKAEVILAQLYVGRTPKLHPVASYINGTRCICPCRTGATNDVEHYLLRCPDRSASRRAELPSPRDRAGMRVQQIIRKWPEKVLAFLWREGFFEEPLALCRN